MQTLYFNGVPFDTKSMQAKQGKEVLLDIRISIKLNWIEMLQWCLLRILLIHENLIS